MTGKQLSRLTSQDRVLTANDLFDPNKRPHGAVMALEETKSLVDHSTQAHIFATKAELDAFVAEQSALSEGERKVKVGDNLYITDTGVPDYWWTGVEGQWISELETGAVKVDVDDALKADSANPVQNKVVKAELDKKLNVSSTCELIKWDDSPNVAETFGSEFQDSDKTALLSYMGDHRGVYHGIAFKEGEIKWVDNSGTVHTETLGGGGSGGGGFDPTSLVSVGIGRCSSVSGNCGIAVGYGADADGGVTVGYSASSCSSSVAVGVSAAASATSGVAVGPYASVGGGCGYTPYYATAVGSGVSAHGEATVALGSYVSVSTPGVTIVGSGGWESRPLSSYVMGKVSNGAYVGEGNGDLLRTSWLATAKSCMLPNGPHKGAAIGVYSATCAAFGSYDQGVGLAFVVSDSNGSVCATESFVLPSCKLKALADGTIGGGGESGVEVWTGTVNASGPEEFVGSKNLGTDDSPKYARWHNRGEDIHAVSGFSNETDTHWNHRFIIPWELARTNDSTYMATNVKWQGQRKLIEGMGCNADTTFVQPLMPANTGATSSIFPYAIPAFEESPVYWSGTIMYNNSMNADGTYSGSAKSVTVPWGSMCAPINQYTFMVSRNVGEKSIAVVTGLVGHTQEVYVPTTVVTDDLVKRVKALEDKLAAVGA